MNTFEKKFSFVYLLLGAGLYLLVTWRWNVALAGWLAPVLLMRYFRGRRRWLATLPAIPLLWAVSYFNKVGVWGMDPALEAALLGIAALPMLAALTLDRFTARRLTGVWRSLVFPAAYVTLDYALSFLPLGTVFSPAVGQLGNLALAQTASLAGIWGIEFLMLWAAPVANALWEEGFQPGSTRRAAILYAVCLAAALIYGGLRLDLLRPQSTTVRVAGVTVAHPRNYWDELIDAGTPEEKAQALAPEFQAIEDSLFAESERAAQSGAKVIFWSEADAFLLPEHQAAFLQRAHDFAVEHQVYLMPAYQALRYGDTSGYNGLTMFTPQGEIAYSYEKTKSWYATTSDGVLHSVDTPYGRISSAVCFDMDFPALIRQAAQQQVDLFLVPAFDTYQASPYHTEVGLLRSVEDGFATVRMVNEGTSMAVDNRGLVLAVQDFFTTPERVMLVDLPTRGVSTLYGRLGDWLAWGCGMLTVALLAAVAKKEPRPWPEVQKNAG